MNKLFVDLFDTGIKELKSSDPSSINRFLYPQVNPVIGLAKQELPMPIKPSMIDKPSKIDYLDTPNIYIPEEIYELPKGSLDEFKTKFDTHIEKLKSIKFQIPTQLKEIYLNLVAKLENILNYIEDVAVGLFAEFVEYLGRFIQWLTGPTQRTADEILIEIKDVNEYVELL